MAEQPDMPEPLPPRAYAIVEAFIDGERVDPAGLKEALEDAGAREHLVELLILRETIGNLEPVRWTAGASRAWVARRRLRWMAGAAAAVLLGLGAGFVTGQRLIEPVTATVETLVAPDTGLPAPEPTRSIVLQPGVNWTDGPGGR